MNEQIRAWLDERLKKAEAAATWAAVDTESRRRALERAVQVEHEAYQGLENLRELIRLAERP